MGYRRSIVSRAGAISFALLAASCSSPAAPQPPTAASAPLPAAPSAAASAAPAASPASAPSSAPSAAGSSAGAAPFRPPEQTHVNIVYGTNSGEDEFLNIAQQNDFYSSYGLTATLNYVASVTAIASLVSGEAQFALGDGAGASQAIANGGNIVILAYFDQTNPYAILTTPSVATPADLKGKTFAIGKAGDTSDVSARIGLSSVGLQLDTDVTPLQIGNGPDRFTALRTGQVSGAIADAVVYVDQAQEQGMHVLVNLQEQKIPYVASALIVRRDYAAANPNTVQDTLKALIDGARYYKDDANQQASLAAIAKDLQLSPDAPEVKQNYDAYHPRIALDPSPTPAGMQTVLTALQSIDPARFQSMTLSDFIDPSYMDALKQQGFL